MGRVRGGGFVGGMLNSKKVHGQDDGNNKKDQATDDRKNDSVATGLGSSRRIRGLLFGKEARSR